MTISYRTAGAWGAGIARDLHPAEVDQNFYELKGLVDAIQVALPASTVSIESMEQIGNTLYVHLTDASVLGPFNLPILKLNFRADWVASTAYLINDVVTADESVYVVLFDHTSALTFDPGASDGYGNDFYGRILSFPSNALPTGGTTGQVLAKSSDDDFDIAWATAYGVPTGGAVDEVLTKVSASDYDVAWAALAVTGVPPGGDVDATLTKLSSTNYDVDWIVRGKTISITGTAHPLVLTDTYGWLRCTNASGCSITVPANATVAFALDTEITIRSATAGAVSIAPDVGVTLNIPVGFTGVLLSNGATALIKKVATNTWDLAGLLTPG